MIKEKLKKTVALMLSAAMVLGLAPSMAGGIKTYADGKKYKALDLTNTAFYTTTGCHIHDDSSNIDVDMPTGAIFMSSVPTDKSVDEATATGEGKFETTQLSGDYGEDFELTARYDAKVGLGITALDETQAKNVLSKYVGSVIYSDSTGSSDIDTPNKITVAKGEYSYKHDDKGNITDEKAWDVYLVIQGCQIELKDDGTETDETAEFYSRIKLDTIMTSTTAGYLEIQLDLDDGIDVNKCKIWLETDFGIGSGTFYAVPAEEHTHSSTGKQWLSLLDGDGKTLKHSHFCETDFNEETGDIGCPFYLTTLFGAENHTYDYIAFDDLDEDIKEAFKKQSPNFDFSIYHFYQCSVCKAFYPYPVSMEYYGTMWFEEHSYTKYGHDDTNHWNVCEYCDYIKPSSSEKHSPSDAYVDTDPTHHWKTCKICYIDGDDDNNVKLDYAPHNFNEEGICKDCGYGEKGETEDTFTYIKEKEATCVDEGNEEYWEYTAGGSTTYYQAIGETVNVLGISGIRQLEIVPNKPIKPIDPDNHKDQNNDYEDYDVEYVSINSSNHKLVCSGCKAKLSEAPHNFDGNVCTDCGYRKSSGGSSNTNTGWIKDSKGWKYRNSDGIIAQGSTVTDKDGNKVEKVLWQKAGNGYYAFGSDGYLVTGWIYDKLEDKWYYCDENMGKLYGWFNESQDGYWYYLSPSTGEALTGWQSINGKDYYFASAPSAPTYSFDAVAGFWIYSNINGVRPFGSMYANTVTPDNYQVDANGAWIH